MNLWSEMMEKILIVLIVILVLMIALLVFITIKNKKKNVDIENDFNDEIKILEDISPKKKNVIVDEVYDFDKLSKKEEVLENVFEDFGNDYKEKVDDDIEQIEIKNEVTQIIDLMQVNSKSLSEKVSDYEDEQEENAIISYTELLNAVKSKKEVQEKLKFDNYNEIKDEDFVSDIKISNSSKNKKFKNSEAISPLGRISKNNNEESYKSDIKKTNMYKDANNTDEFLKSLKDFRDNL